MLESNKENNLENKNPSNSNDRSAQLKQNLLSDNIDNNNKKLEENFLISLPKIGNEETAFTENIEEEIQNNDYTQTIENKNINKNKYNENNNKININDKKISKKIGVNLTPLEEDNKNYSTNVTISEFRNSNLSRNTFQKIVEENNKEIDKKINEQKINNVISKLRIILIIIEIFLGILLCISSIVILLIFFKDNIINQKFIAILVEPIIFLISFIGIIPYKGKNFKKIIVSLYLWEGLFLFPFSFYSKSLIEDKHLNNLCNRILIARIYLLSAQFFNFILSLILKINI